MAFRQPRAKNPVNRSYRPVATTIASDRVLRVVLGVAAPSAGAPDARSPGAFLRDGRTLTPVWPGSGARAPAILLSRDGLIRVAISATGFDERAPTSTSRHVRGARAVSRGSSPGRTRHRSTRASRSASACEELVAGFKAHGEVGQTRSFSWQCRGAAATPALLLE